MSISGKPGQGRFASVVAMAFKDGAIGQVEYGGEKIQVLIVEVFEVTARFRGFHWGFGARRGQISIEDSGYSLHLNGGL